MPKETVLITGSHPIAKRIADSIGLEHLLINSLSIHIEADEVVSATCIFFPTQEQLKELEKEVAKLNGNGTIMGEVELFFSSELEPGEDEQRENDDW